MSDEEAVMEFVAAYEKYKWKIVVEGGQLMGVQTFAIEYCKNLTKESDNE